MKWRYMEMTFAEKYNYLKKYYPGLYLTLGQLKRDVSCG